MSVLLALAGVLAITGGLIAALSVSPPVDLPDTLFWKLIVAGTIVAAGYGLYLLIARIIVATASRTPRATSSTSTSSSPRSGRSAASSSRATSPPAGS